MKYLNSLLYSNKISSGNEGVCVYLTNLINSCTDSSFSPRERVVIPPSKSVLILCMGRVLSPIILLVTLTYWPRQYALSLDISISYLIVGLENLDTISKAVVSITSRLVSLVDTKLVANGNTLNVVAKFDTEFTDEVIEQVLAFDNGASESGEGSSGGESGGGY